MDICGKITRMLTEADVPFSLNEPMKTHCSFNTGGEADLFISPKGADDIHTVLDILDGESCPYTVIGNGTNLLVSDKGIRGAVICIGKNMSSVRAEGNVIYAGAGALLSNIASLALKNSLSGFEALSGIPGCVGGALFMNAGAYGSDMAGVVRSVTYTEDKTVRTLKKDSYNGGYRKSVFTGTDRIICEASFELCKSDADTVRENMASFRARRFEKQPLSYPSAGSVFKRPEGYFAGALIEGAGLKGTKIGGAQVSEKHAGFIINRGGATSEDIYSLIELVREKVYKTSGVTLECEVKMIGEF